MKRLLPPLACPLAAAACSLAALCLLAGSVSSQEAADSDAIPQQLQRWLGPQDWQRDTPGPVIELSPSGAFDDTHIFAPCVALEGEQFRMWYCGSTGRVAERVFQLGLAASTDGRTFERHAASPVCSFGDGRHSVLTPTLLRRPHGAVLREDGRLRMWFSATHFAGRSNLHTLHESFSTDGISWSQPSPPLLEHVYAPTILKEGESYRMWYTDVSASPWLIRYAESRDGRRWRVREEPVLKLDQSWEQGNLFYPTVVKADGAYLMWYGSYWSQQANKTALGLAVSLNGWRWYKHPQNPVLRPDPQRAWESHYTTSQSVLRLSDGSWRIWYASRKAPPFVNKYFAINTARWQGPGRQAEEENPLLDPAALQTEAGRAAFTRWQATARSRLRSLLGIPKTRLPLDAELRGTIPADGFTIEKWVYTSEAGSRVPAVLYLPRADNLARTQHPAVALTFGHGGSKSHVSYQYIGQLYAKLGIACLAADPIGEEERHQTLGRGTRAHDPYTVHRRAWDAGRPIMGKLVFDCMRGIDFLLARDDIDPQRIGVAGNSLGGAKASWMAALDDRLRFAVISGWALDDVTLWSKYCTSAPNQRLRESLDWHEYLALAAPHCSVLITNGTADVVIDRAGDGAAWAGTRRAVAAAEPIYAALGEPAGVQCWFEPGGGHRPYPAHRAAVEWLFGRLGWPEAAAERIADRPDVNFGAWAERHGVGFEPLYGTALHLRGATVLDMDIAPRDDLGVLRADEAGRGEFTLEGWLQHVVAAP